MIGDIPAHWKRGKRRWYAPWLRYPDIWVPEVSFEQMQRELNGVYARCLDHLNTASPFERYITPPHP